MSTRTFSKDEVIFRQGDYASEMFDILSGSVGIYAGYATEHETQLAVLKAGDFLGEMGIIDTCPRSATAVAMEEGTELSSISETEYAEYFKNQPERLLLIMRQLSGRLRVCTESYREACSIRDEMLATQKQPEGRNKTLLEKIKAIFNLYDEAMKSGVLSLPIDNFSPGASYIPYMSEWR